MFEREQRDPRKEESKLGGEPHPDAQRNLEYCLGVLNQIECLEPTLTYCFYDTMEDPNSPQRENKKGAALSEWLHDSQYNKIVSKPMCVYFDWKERGEWWSGNRSFHADHAEFRKYFCEAVNFLLQKRFVKRKDIQIGTFKRISPPSQHRMKDSFDELFAR